MFKINDIVLYGAHSVCKVADITAKELGGESVEYYVLKPVYDTKSTLFVPVHNKVLTSRMRPVLSASEVWDLIKSIPSEKSLWIENDKVRKEKYKEIISEGNRAELVSIIKAIYLHEQELKEKGKKLHIADDNTLKEAEKMLYDEFAYVLEIDREDVLSCITAKIESVKKK